MPRGGRRLGAGRPRRAPLGLAATSVVTFPSPEAGQAWRPTADELAGLGPDGRAFIDRVLGTYEPSVVDGFQVIEAARATDALALLRAERAPDLKQIRLWSGFLTLMLSRLGLTK